MDKLERCHPRWADAASVDFTPNLPFGPGAFMQSTDHTALPGSLIFTPALPASTFANLK